MTKSVNLPIPEDLDLFVQQNADKWQTAEQQSFYELLLRFVCRSGKCNADIAKAARVNKSTVTRLLSKQTASSKRDTVIAIAFALELNAEELTLLLKARDIHDCFPADKKDHIILYQAANGSYDIEQLNDLLRAYGCSLIGRTH